MVPGVELELVEVGHQAGIEKALQVGGLEVGGADGAQLAGFQELHQALEGFDKAVLVGVGPVHQQQVDVVHAEPGEAGLAGLTGAVHAVPLAVELGGDEDFFTGQAGAAQAFAHAAFVAVVLGGIQMTVAQVEGFGDGDGRLVVVHGPGAEAEQGDADAVGEGEAGGEGNGHGALLVRR